MVNWNVLLRSIVLKVRDAITPLLGTSAANADVGAGAGGDTTKKIDAIAEEVILAELESTGQALKIITEEKGIVYLNCPRDEEDVAWHAIIDPIDGSVNATKNLPFFAVSIAIASGSRFRDITDGAVLNVATGDIFTASRGQGCWLNGTRLSLNGATTRLPDAIMGIDLNHKKGEFVRSELVRRYAPLINAPRKIRVLGSNALELCLVATSALDCFVDVRGSLRVIDIAAAWLIVQEAGGHVFEIRDGYARSLDDLDLSLDTRLAISAATSIELNDELMREWKKCVVLGKAHRKK